MIFYYKIMAIPITNIPLTHTVHSNQYCKRIDVKLVKIDTFYIKHFQLNNIGLSKK